MKSIVCVVGVALAWVLLFQLNMSLFSNLKQTHFITWIFIPAGLRLVTILLFGEIAIIGLFIGALLSGLILQIGLSTAIVLSLISAINPYISVNLTKAFLNIDDLLSNLSAVKLITLSFASALFSGICHNIYFYYMKMSTQPLIDTVGMFTGDFIGCLLLLYIFAFTIKLIRKSV
jgi:hypothetical protein